MKCSQHTPYLQKLAANPKSILALLFLPLLIGCDPCWIPYGPKCEIAADRIALSDLAGEWRGEGFFEHQIVNISCEGGYVDRVRIRLSFRVEKLADGAERVSYSNSRISLGSADSYCWHYQGGEWDILYDYPDIDILFDHDQLFTGQVFNKDRMSGYLEDMGVQTRRLVLEKQNSLN